MRGLITATGRRLRDAAWDVAAALLVTLAALVLSATARADIWVIDKTVAQIQAVEVVLDRAQGLDPKAVRSVAELNQYMARTREAKRTVEELMGIRSEAARVAISQSALQGETAYLMGQEMMATGASLAQDSRIASPGRAAQISAASNSAQMLAQGVQL